MSVTRSTTPAKRSDRDVIEMFRAYNRSQLKKIADMENVTLSSDDTTLNDRSQIETTETVNPVNDFFFQNFEILKIFDSVN